MNRLNYHAIFSFKSHIKLFNKSILVEYIFLPNFENILKNMLEKFFKIESVSSTAMKIIMILNNNLLTATFSNFLQYSYLW